MMKKILMSVYAVCALLVIIGSLLWFVFTLHSDSTAGKTEALKNFKMFAQHTGRILSESAQERNPTQLQVQLEQLCRNYSKYVKAARAGGLCRKVENTCCFFRYGADSVLI